LTRPEFTNLSLVFIYTLLNFCASRCLNSEYSSTGVFTWKRRSFSDSTWTTHWPVNCVPKVYLLTSYQLETIGLVAFYRMLSVDLSVAAALYFRGTSSLIRARIFVAK